MPFTNEKSGVASIRCISETKVPFSRLMLSKGFLRCIHIAAASFSKYALNFLVGLMRRQTLVQSMRSLPSPKSSVLCGSDEYILPKIAERELRRFANLRSTASQHRVQLPLDEMPIKCPLSRIIKPRKAQGVDCFEVSWEQMDGLETSIVPADLVQRACPERILEFQERRAQGKKRNTNRSRPRKLEKTPLGQIDQKLQDLLLEIDRESSATNYTTFLCGSVSEDDESFAQIQLVDPGIQSHDTWNSNSVKKGGFTSGSAICQESDILPASSEDEVIDLTSPPPRHASGNSKVQEDKVQRMDMIELSDSENDMFSPEHTRRSRELRMFIAGIKDTTY